MRTIKWVLVAASIAVVLALAAAPAAAHNDSCLLAVHAGGTQVHLVCL